MKYTIFAVGELLANAIDIDANAVGWHGVDLDGTLAEFHGWSPVIGRPIKKMVDRVKRWLARGEHVKIMTARVARKNSDRKQQEQLVKAFCKKYIGQELEVTCEKDKYMIDIWDDRARQVEFNKGNLVTLKAAKVAMASGVRNVPRRSRNTKGGRNAVSN